jgi:hypothetical protein
VWNHRSKLFWGTPFSSYVFFSGWLQQIENVLFSVKILRWERGKWRTEQDMVSKGGIEYENLFVCLFFGPETAKPVVHCAQGHYHGAKSSHPCTALVSSFKFFLTVLTKAYCNTSDSQIDQLRHSYNNSFNIVVIFDVDILSFFGLGKRGVISIALTAVLFLGHIETARFHHRWS